MTSAMGGDDSAKKNRGIEGGLIKIDGMCLQALKDNVNNILG
jgi:hypothetical protein